ncbi:ClpXP protease specificity-enhancing factor [Lysobacter solisilvae (ex Woo and Kim 2020)]|uniref:ClpXP protease specificity-enhancing factor n=1 Tax=Agrilutibacter terrestris TaxID=2865112 RepID=A0A7H0FYH5_9GAMM|nr:ClpXP protease specificity-enhancing factor [Lysobacter terrestris]QNP41091.1 ClpXP protease specificity-enhancing factor [Lysobacter terrestris]
MSEDSTAMTSHRPYLLRALYEWIADNGMTPHLLVDATRPHVQVPAHAVKDGRIVLNVAERAVAGLQMTNDVIRFSARFGGVSHSVSVPVAAVLAIYARETGQGMALPEESLAGNADEAEVEIETDEDEATAPAPLSIVHDDDAPGGGDDEPTPPTPRRSGHLRIVK